MMAMICGVAAFGLEAPSLPDDGQALAAHLRSTPPPEDVEVTGRIRIRLEDGRRTSRPFATGCSPVRINGNRSLKARRSGLSRPRRW
jgi:hypothetical protein